jgi:hypothetical protein
MSNIRCSAEREERNRAAAKWGCENPQKRSTNPKPGVLPYLTIIRLFAGAVGVDKALQNQHGSDLVDDFPVAGQGAPGGVQVAVGLGGSEALVPEVDREGEGLAERLGESVGSGGLGADVAGHIERIAEDDSGAAVFAQEAPQGFEVLLRVFADQGEDGLSGEAELIGDGDADAAGAEIEAQEAGFHSRDGNPETDRKPHLRMS